MQRRRTLIIAALTVTAALAGFVVAGSAFGAEWHDYDGRLPEGQAHVVPVPKDADALSFALLMDNTTDAFARFTVLDPEGARVGNFELNADKTTVDVLDPAEGPYVVFVYEVEGADLGVRLLTAEAQDLRIVRADMERVDRPIVRGHSGELSREVVLDVDREPLFMTLLYEGSAENLDAQVVTEKGVVLTIAGESGTAYVPGVGMDRDGARTMNVLNTAGGKIDVTARADDFSGTLVLTVLHAKLPAAGDHVVPGEAVPENVTVAHSRIAAGVPTAVEVTQGSLVLALPSYFEAEKEDEEDERRHRHRSWNPMKAYARVYDPDDAYVGTYQLTREDPAVTLANLTDGEYVVYAWGSRTDRGDDVLGVAFPDADAVPDVRALKLVEGEALLGSYDALLGMEDTANHTFDAPPLGLAVSVADADLVTGFEATAKSPKGEAHHAYVLSGMAGWSLASWYDRADPEHLVAGEYVITMRAVNYVGDVNLKWITFDRGLEANATAEEETDEGDGSDDDTAEPAGNRGVGGLAGDAVSVVAGALGL